MSARRLTEKRNAQMTKDTAPSPASDKAALTALIAPQAGVISRAAWLTALSSLIWVAQAALVAGAFARLLTGAGVTLWVASAGFLALFACRIALNYLAEGMLFRASAVILTDTRARILARESRRSGPSEIGGPGAIAALAGEKLDALTPYLTRFALVQKRVMVVPLTILALAFWHSWAVGLVLLVAGPVIPVFMALVGYAAKEASERQMQEIGSLSDLLVDRLAALSDIRMIGAAPRLSAQFAEAAEALRSRTMAVLRVAFLSSTVLEFFAALGVAMVAVWVGFSLLGQVTWGAWGGTLSPWVGIFLLLLAPEYFQPLRDLSAAWHDKAAALAVAQELAFYEAEDEVTILGTGTDAVPLSGAATLALRGVTARRGARLIRYPDVEIAAGARVALSGSSGAGKTTLLHLLAGLQRPEAGEIRVAGQVLNDTSADGWRARLGWMPQAPMFLARSLRHNVTFGAPLAPELLETAALSDVIATLPKGDLTVLGETGGGLSGGEARRVMLARAMAAAPDVVLVDEPTADLDRETAARVTEGLLALSARGATVIVATHDPVLIARMDQVIEIAPEEVSHA